MSVSIEVQRTLVKSPPELWTELSNLEVLARHLGDFGEIRITKTEPETTVEWEAEEASGVVQLKQSGWGTKVTLSVTRTPAVPAQTPVLEAETEPESAIVVEPVPIRAVESEQVVTEPPAPVDPEPEPEEESEPAIVAEPEPIGTVEPEPVATKPEPVAGEPEPPAPDHEPPPGFFARLFRKRKAEQAAMVAPEPKPSVTVQPEVEAEPEPAVEPEPEPAIEVVALAAPELLYPDPEVSEPAEDLASELESLEAQMAAETTELLTGVLDRLGAAHHRPFSRG